MVNPNTEAAIDAAQPETGTSAALSRDEMGRMILAAIGTSPHPCDRLFARADINLVFDGDLPQFLNYGAMGLLGFVSDMACDQVRLPDTPEVKAALRICRAALDVLEPLANVPDETDETPSDADALHALRAELHSLRPAVLEAAQATEVSQHRCPPLCEDYSTDVEHGDVLGKWLSLSLQVARIEATSDELSGDGTEPLELEDAFRLLADVVWTDDRGDLGDKAMEADQINDVRASFAQVRGQLNRLEDDYEGQVARRVKELHHDLLCIENRGRNR